MSETSAVLTEEKTPVEGDASAASKAAGTSAAVPMGAAGGGLLLCGLSAAALYSFGHDGILSCHGPGIGITVSHWGLTAAVLWAAKSRKRLRLCPAGLFLLSLSVLLSGAYAVFANTTLRLLNLPVLLAVTTQALFSLTEQNTHPALNAQGLWEGLRRYADSLFRWWKVPFASAGKLARNRKKASRSLAAGIVAGISAALMAAAILATADQVFFSILDSAAERLTELDHVAILRIGATVLLTLLIFSHLFSLLQAPAKIRPMAARISDPTVFSLVLAGLALVYALFGYVQIRYLFAGVESVRMSGGYAAYARTGFFQLVLVALLTLGVILPALTLFPESRAVRVLCGLTAALTVIIDVSAFVRMRMYIGAYGLSTLRVVTLWGIAVILLALLAALAKAVRPAWRICPALAVVVLISWVALNWINVNRVVANDLVARFNAGPESADVQTLASDQYWNPDYYAAFANIADPSSRRAALKLLDARGNEKMPNGRAFKDPSLYDWSLAYLRQDGTGD